MTHRGTCKVCGRHLEFTTQDFLSYSYLTCNIARVTPAHSSQELRAAWSNYRDSDLGN